MARNAEQTRARILEAATAEFSARGIAGARVDRIADAAACNKALLYSYFGNKEQLFDAVFAALVARLVAAHPIDAEHLDEYAGALVDSYVANPELVRLALWDRLERGGAGMRSPSCWRRMPRRWPPSRTPSPPASSPTGSPPTRPSP